jgi:hypothetical protein
MPTVANPTFSPIAGAYNSTDYPKTITIATATAGCNIRWTAGGSNPTPTYGNLISASSGRASIAAGQTLKAIAYRSGYINSAVVSGTYTAKVVTPTFTPPDGSTFSHLLISVNVQTSTPGASLSYTTDGSLPSPTHGKIVAGGTNISIQITKAVGVTVRAMAFKSGMNNSAVSQAYYSFDPGGNL